MIEIKSRFIIIQRYGNLSPGTSNDGLERVSNELNRPPEEAQAYNPIAGNGLEETINIRITMNFFEAMQKLSKGTPVRSKKWDKGISLHLVKEEQIIDGKKLEVTKFQIFQAGKPDYNSSFNPLGISTNLTADTYEEADHIDHIA